MKKMVFILLLVLWALPAFADTNREIQILNQYYPKVIEDFNQYFPVSKQPTRASTHQTLQSAYQSFKGGNHSEAATSLRDVFDKIIKYNNAVSEMSKDINMGNNEEESLMLLWDMNFLYAMECKLSGNKQSARKFFNTILTCNALPTNPDMLSRINTYKLYAKQFIKECQ